VHCNSCGSKNADINKYCGSCGKPLKDTEDKNTPKPHQEEAKSYSSTELPNATRQKPRIKHESRSSQGPGNMIQCKQCGTGNKRLSIKSLGGKCYKCGAVLIDTPRLDKNLPKRDKPLKVGRGDSGQIQSFFWGYIWVILAYISSLAMLSLYIWAFFDTGDPALLLFGVIAIPSILSGYGVHTRKRWGLNLTNILLILSIIASVFELSGNDSYGILRGLGQITVAILWLKYFNSRWNLFH
jgi:hypothetical protein